MLHNITGFRCGWHCLHSSSLTVFPSLLTVCIYVYMAFWPLYWRPNNCQNACKCLDVCLTHGDKVAFGNCRKCPLQFEWTCKVYLGQRMLLVNSGWTKVDQVSTWVVTHFLQHDFIIFVIIFFIFSNSFYTINFLLLNLVLYLPGLSALYRLIPAKFLSETLLWLRPFVWTIMFWIYAFQNQNWQLLPPHQIIQKHVASAGWCKQ